MLFKGLGPCSLCHSNPYVLIVSVPNKEFERPDVQAADVECIRAGGSVFRGGG